MNPDFLLLFKNRFGINSFSNQISRVRYFNAILFIVLFSATAYCQGVHASFFRKLKSGAPLPEKLLSTRSVVVYPHTMTQKNLEDIQLSFQQSGIDAVAYFDIDVLLAGKDMSRALAFNFNKRDINNLVFFEKVNGTYRVYITTFNTKDSFVEENQYAWSNENTSLPELLKTIYRASASGLKRSNLLINDVPETDLMVNPITGRRSEFFAIDLKVDPMAVPKFGDEAMDKELESILTIYPLKYKLTEPNLSERDLRTQGSLYVLCYVHTRGSIAKEILGYDMTKPESAYVSVTYPNGQPQLKTYSKDDYVYKFYFKHIESGNVFFGTKWDADTTWQQALKNHLMAFKAELKLN